MNEQYEEDSNGVHDYLGDYFIYNLDCNIKKFFFLFYCDFNYGKKNIDNLTNEIFEILDKGVFDGYKLKKSSRDEINNILEQYQKLTPKFEKQNVLNEINNFKDEENIIKKKNIYKRKRFNSRIIITKIPKTKTLGEVSIDIDDLTSIKDSASNVSLSKMFKKNINDEENNSRNKIIKKIKMINILFYFLLFLIMLVILIILNFI